MSLRGLVRFAVIAFSLLSVTACYFGLGPDSYPCEYETRHALATTELRDSSARLLGTAEVTLGQARFDDSLTASLHVTMTGLRGSGGGPLKGHVHDARIIAGAESADTIEIDTGWPFLLQTRDDIIVPARSELAPERADSIRAGFLADRVTLELETDVARVGLYRPRLALKSHSDWERPTCGGST